MRTNIDIDDTLLAEAMTLTGLSTKKATVEEALRRLVRHHRQRDALTGPRSRQRCSIPATPPMSRKRERAQTESP